MTVHKRFRHGYDVKADLNYLHVKLWFPTTIEPKTITTAFSIFLDLIVKANKIEKYNTRSKYDKL